MATSSEDPSEDSSFRLSQEVEVEAAWGRSRFTEAEIKKAFELRDHELRRAEEEAVAIQDAARKANNTSRKGAQKAAETKKAEVRRKEELKAKKEAKPVTDKKKGPSDSKDDGADSEDPQANELAQAEAWKSLLTYNFTQDASDLASLVAEQQKAESFEDWAIAVPSSLPTPKSKHHPVFESERYQVRPCSLEPIHRAIWILVHFRGCFASFSPPFLPLEPIHDKISILLDLTLWEMSEDTLAEPVLWHGEGIESLALRARPVEVSPLVLSHSIARLRIGIAAIYQFPRFAAPKQATDPVELMLIVFEQDCDDWCIALPSRRCLYVLDAAIG